MDGTIPRKHLGHVLRAIEEMEKKVRFALHERVPCRRRQPASADPVRREPARRVGARRPFRRRHPRAVRANSAARSPASTASASKRSTRCACSSRRQEREAFFGVKRAFDPNGLLNPGKAIPTLARCAEYGQACTCIGGAAAVRRPAAILSRDGSRRSPHLRDRIVAAHQAQYAVAPARRRHQGFLRRTPGRRHRSTRAAHAGIVDYEPIGTRDHRALRHAAVGDRSTRWPRHGQFLAVRAAGVRWRSDDRRRRRGGTCPGRGARAPARCATSCSGASLLDAPRRAAALRRPGDEERGRLRCVAPAVRLARHPRPDHCRCR